MIRAARGWADGRSCDQRGLGGSSLGFLGQGVQKPILERNFSFLKKKKVISELPSSYRIKGHHYIAYDSWLRMHDRVLCCEMGLA